MANGKNFVTCCGRKTKVINSRYDDDAVYRLRKCLVCSAVYMTIELSPRSTPAEMMVARRIKELSSNTRRRS